MSEKVLITGGAGFVGSHLADELLEAGYDVRIFDNLEDQVHRGRRPDYLSEEAELQIGTLLDARALARALEEVDHIVHFAAAVGVGQSMYQPSRYSRINLQGTAELLEALLHRQKKPGTGVSSLLVASSMSVYGEGRYTCPACGPVTYPVRRTLEQLRRQQWDPLCTTCGAALHPELTGEGKPLELHSLYALTKFAQEEMVLLFGGAYQIPAVALRFWNIYGPRQALDNPYTGVVAIFAARLLAGQAPQLFEDGRQQRDFVSVHDVARACHATIKTPAAAGQRINLGSGQRMTIAELAQKLAETLDSPLEPEITRRFRVGDIRHCLPDIQTARTVLGYEPRVDLPKGLAELVCWLRQQPQSRPPRSATVELQAWGLTG